MKLDPRSIGPQRGQDTEINRKTRVDFPEVCQRQRDQSSHRLESSIDSQESDIGYDTCNAHPSLRSK